MEYGEEGNLREVCPHEEVGENEEGKEDAGNEAGAEERIQEWVCEKIVYALILLAISI